MHLRIAQDLAAVPAAPPNRRYRLLDQQIKDIVQDYPNRNFIDSQSFIVLYSINFFYRYPNRTETLLPVPVMTLNTCLLSSGTYNKLFSCHPTAYSFIVV